GLYALNEAVKDNDIVSLAYLLQVYIQDIKIVPMHTPVVLEKQNAQILKNIRNSKKEQYLHFLEKKLAELEFIEDHRTNKEFFFFIYEEIINNILKRTNYMKNII